MVIVMEMPRWLRAVAERLRPSALVSIADPRAMELFGSGFPMEAGVPVNESTSLSVSSVYRAVALISGTVATLPLRTIRETGDGMRQRMKSVFDDPGYHAPIRLTPFNWVETTLCHLLLHGNAYLRHIYGGAGQLVAFEPVHPLLVGIELPYLSDDEQPVGGKWFRFS
jgi:phage portal protein BeeE